MTTPTNATYVGAKTELIGKTALIREDDRGTDLVHAQFDEIGLSYNGLTLSSGWHLFRADEFEPIDMEPTP